MDDKLLVCGSKAPAIEDFEKITPEQFRLYVEYVAELRHNQRRYFATRKPDALRRSKEMERELDILNARLLDKQLSMF